MGHYLTKDEGDDPDTYSLTYAGLQVARGVAAGTYIESVDWDPVSLPEPCPFCAQSALELRGRDSLTTVACDGCDRDVHSLPFQPGGFRSHDEASLPRASDIHHRYRISLMADGNCPECGGAVGARGDVVGDDSETDSSAQPPLARVSLDCGTCGYALRCPVTVAVLDPPAVVAFAHDHGASLDDRPICNVGPEWAERVVSTDPLAVRVTLELDDELLSLFVGRDLTVAHESRRPLGEPVGTDIESVAEAEEVEAKRDGRTDSDSAAARVGPLLQQVQFLDTARQFLARERPVAPRPGVDVSRAHPDGVEFAGPAVLRRHRPQCEVERLVERVVLVVLLLESLLDGLAVRADGDGLPLVGGSRGVRLEQAGRPALVDTTDEQGHTERPCTASLGVLLDVVGDGLCQALDGHRLFVPEPFDLCLSAGEVDQLAGIRGVARAGDAEVVVYLVYLLDAVGDLKRRADPAPGDEDDPVVGPDTDARRATLHRLTCVLDLVEPTVRREDGDTAVVRLLL